MDGWMNGWMNGWMGGWTDGPFEGHNDWWTDRQNIQIDTE